VVPVRVTHLPNRVIPILGMSLNFEFQKFSGVLVSFKFALAYLQDKKKIRVELKNKRNKDKMIINVRIKKN
jgi:hypothetical protein